VRLLILSDLHREVWYGMQTWYEGKADPFPAIELARSRPDAVILAGDIDVGPRAVAWAEAAFAGFPVLYVPGNHEAYGRDVVQVQTEIDAAAAASANVYALHRRVHTIGQVRFLGATLWTDFDLYGSEHRLDAADEACRRLCDYTRIRVADDRHRLLTPDDTRRWHEEDLAWLESRVAEPFAGKTVVITHMAPSACSIAERFRGTLLSAAFASDLHRLVERVDVWVHGHTHTSSDYRIGRARIVANPLGYPRGANRDQAENLDFDPNRVVIL